MKKTDGDIYDVVVIGAGAAGLMTSVVAAREGLKVLLLDGQEKIGAKILMSGGTRCNVTNETVEESDYASGKIKIVRNILRGFDSAKVLKFFEDLGVEFVKEPGGKYFPVTHSGKTVLETLLKAVAQSGVRLKHPCRVQKINSRGDIFVVQGDEFSFNSRAVVLCTGGLSYPQTGSDGKGYTLAKKFGHGIIEATPALTPLVATDSFWADLKGVSCPVSLVLYTDGRKIREFQGSFLFTHFGFSGPVVLDASRYWKRAEGTRELRVNFLPGQNSEGFERSLIAAGQSGQMTVKKLIGVYFPERLTEKILESARVDPKSRINLLNKETRRRLMAQLFQYPLPVKDVYGYGKAEVTAGGVDFNEVDGKTLESKHQPGLFFAGEILDVDGRIGGFNFQWAWSSGYAVGTALIKRMKGERSDVRT